MKYLFTLTLLLFSTIGICSTITSSCINQEEKYDMETCNNTDMSFGNHPVAFSMSSTSEKAIICDLKLQFLPIIGCTHDSTSYYLPQYFTDNLELQNKITEILRENLSKYYGVTDISFYQKDFAETYYGLHTSTTNIKNINKSEGDIFLSIVATLFPQNKLVLKLLIENSTSKKIFKNSVTIPITSLEDIYPYIPGYMSVIDFENTYILALKTVFDKKAKRRKAVNIKSPINEQYISFYKNATIYTLEISDDSYTLINKQNEKEEVANFKLKGKGLKTKSGGKWQLGGLSSEKIKKNSLFYNEILDSSYIMHTQQKKHKAFDSNVPSEITVDIENNNHTIGNLSTLGGSTSKVKYAGNNYNIVGIQLPYQPKLQELYYFEFIVNGKTIAIVSQFKGNPNVISISDELTNIEKGRLFTILFAWQESSRLGKD